MEPGFKTQLVTSLRSPGRGYARDIAGPREDGGCMRFWEARSRNGRRGSRRRCDDRWCGKRPLRWLCGAWAMAMRQKMRANRMDNSAVQVVLPSRRLLTPHLAPQRRSARVSAVEYAMTDGAGRGPCAGCVQAPYLWTMAMRRKMRANRMDNSAVQVMLPSRRLLTSRRRGSRGDVD